MSVVRYDPIAECPGYRVGTDGSVWTCLRADGRRRPYKMTNEWCPLKLDVRRYGHCYVRLRSVDGCVRRQVHHLVLEAFVGPRPAGLEGCHENGKPSDNSLGNLRWDTHASNMADRARHGTLSGENHGRAKMTVDAVRALRLERKNGAKFSDLAAKYGVGRSQARRIAGGEHWRVENL